MTVSKDAEGAIGGDRRPAARGKAPSGATKVRYFVSVSYTHLTLPTILLV